MKFFTHHFRYQGYLAIRYIRLDTVISVEAVSDSGGVAKVYIDHAGKSKSTEIADRTVAEEFMRTWQRFVDGRD